MASETSISDVTTPRALKPKSLLDKVTSSFLIGLCIAVVATNSFLMVVRLRLNSSSNSFTPSFSPTPNSPVSNPSLLLTTLRAHAGAIHTLAFNPSSTLLAIGFSNNNIKIWTVPKFIEVSNLISPGLLEKNDHVHSLDFNANGTLLVSGSDDGCTINIWHIQQQRLLENHTTKSSQLESCSTSLAFSPDGLLAHGDGGSRILVRTVPPQGQKSTVLGVLSGHGAFVSSVAWSPSGSQLSSASNDFTVNIWDTENFSLRKTLRGHSDWVRCVAYSPDGLYVVSGSADHSVRVWRVRDGSEMVYFADHVDFVTSVDVFLRAEGMRYFVVSGSNDKSVKIWTFVLPNTDGRAKEARLLRTLEGHSKPVDAVKFDAHGRYVASGSVDETIKIWHVQGLVRSDDKILL